VKEISNLYLPPNINPPIALQWKDIKENTTQQTSQATSIRVCDEVEPSNPDDVRDRDWTIVARGAQDAESTNTNPKTISTSSTKAGKSAK
jgi:arginine utilization protein RocB